MSRAIILVLDSFGLGETADAAEFGDVGANTFLHIAERCAQGRCEDGRTGVLKLPHLSALGLGHAAQVSCGVWAPGFTGALKPIGAWGCAAELSSGKDTPSGHWEIAGVPVLFEWGYFDKPTETFPQALIDALVAETGIPGILGNCHGSGTDILVEHGEEHMATGKPICYTSADSVFQIAAHEETFGLDRLMALCEVARRLVDEYNIGRVIARPFVGTQADNFVRTGNRRDLSVLPPAPTVLDGLVAAGGAVTSIGKVADIFAHQGITKKIKANGLKALVDATLDEMAAPNKGQDEIIFTNLVDFDMLYGHRRDVNGYAKALETLDAMMPSIMSAMRPDDLLILTADHGCDPTWKGSDHTREHIPVLAFGAGVTAGNLGVRSTFADIGQTLAQFFTLSPMAYGTSFLSEVDQGV
jgi:phosphopentomutase